MVGCVYVKGALTAEGRHQCFPRRDINPIIGLHQVPHNDAASASSADEDASDNSSRGGLRERSHLAD
jgi:hypothetical protein